MGYLAGDKKADSFATVYPTVIDGLQKAMLTYTESIRQGQGTGPSRALVPGPAVPQLTVKISPDGYPMLPDKLLETCSIKTEQERLVKQYIGQHYSERVLYLVIAGLIHNIRISIRWYRQNRPVHLFVERCHWNGAATIFASRYDRDPATP